MLDKGVRENERGYKYRFSKQLFKNNSAKEYVEHKTELEKRMLAVISNENDVAVQKL